MAQSAHEILGIEDSGSHPDSELTQNRVTTLSPIRGEVTIGRALVGWTLEVPVNATIEALNIFVPGFGGFRATSREPRRALAAYGASLSYGPARSCGSSVVQRLLQSSNAHVATIEAITDSIINSDDAMKTLRTFGINPRLQWLISHSMGGAASTSYAMLHPERIAGRTDLATIGFGSPTLRELARGLPRGILPGIRHELAPYVRSGHIDPTVSSLLQAIMYYTEDPFRTIGEAYTCLTKDVRDDTQRLTDMGINTGYIAAEHDCLVRPSPVIARYVRYFGVMKDCGHLFPQLKSAQMAQQIHRQQSGHDYDL